MASTGIGLFAFYLLGLLIQIYKNIQMWIRVLKVLWTQFKLEIEWHEYIEIFSIFLAITSIALYSANVLSYIGDFQIPVEDTGDLDLIMAKAVSFRNFVRISALTALLLSIKAVVVLKSKFPSFGILFDTVRRANADILNFGFILILLLTAFSLMAHLCFGAQTSDFSSLGNSYFSLFLSMMGQINYDVMNAANPSLSDIFLLFFIVLFVFILINMFLAIVMATYTELREENQELLEAKAEILGEQVKDANRKWINFLCCRIDVKSQEEVAWDLHLAREELSVLSKSIESLVNKGEDAQAEENHKRKLESKIEDYRMTIIKSRSPSILERLKFNLGSITSGVSTKLMTREQAKENLKQTINLISERKRQDKLKLLKEEQASNFKYKLISDMLIFVVFIILFIVMTLSRFRTEHSYTIYQAMYNSLSVPEFNYNGVDINFSQIDRASRAYSWITNVLSPVVSADYIYYENRLVGDPVLRTTLDRVSLEPNDLESSKDAIFWTRLESGAQNRNFYGYKGKGYNYVNKGSADSYQYAGGFVEFYGSNPTEFISNFLVVVSDDLLDDQMQGFVIEYVTYNSNYNSFITVVVTFTNSLSGLFTTSLTVNVLELEPYTNYPVRIFLEIAFFCFTIYYTYIEVKFWLVPWRTANAQRLKEEHKAFQSFQILLELKVRSIPTQGLAQIMYKLTRCIKVLLKKTTSLTIQVIRTTYRYLSSSFFRVINFLSIILSFVTIIQLLLYTSGDFVNNFELPYDGNNHFNEFEDLTILNNNLRSVLAFNLLIIFLRLLQFFKFSKKLSLLTDILASAKLDILFFLLMFVIILFAYALMGYLLLGHYDTSFKTLGESFVSCYSMLLGEFNTTTILMADRKMGGLFFVTFMILFNLLLLNMFIAIIGAHFDSLSSEGKDQKRGFFAEIIHVIRKYWRKKLERVAKKKDDDEDAGHKEESRREVHGDIEEAKENYDDPALVPFEFSPNLWVFKLEDLILNKTNKEVVFSKMVPEFLQNRIDDVLVKPASDHEVLVLNETIWGKLPVPQKLRLWRRMTQMWEETIAKKQELAAVQEKTIKLDQLSKLQQTLWACTSHEDKIELWIGEHRFNDEERIAIWNITYFSIDHLMKLPKYEEGIEQQDLIYRSSDQELETWALSLLSPFRKMINKLMRIEANAERLKKIQDWQAIKSDERLLLWAGLTMFEKQQMYLAQPDFKEATLIALMIMNDIGSNVILIGTADHSMSQLLDGQVHDKYFELAIYEYERHGLKKCKLRVEDAEAENKNTMNYLNYVKASLREKQETLRTLEEREEKQLDD
jgi:hypothetical protein